MRYRQIVQVFYDLTSENQVETPSRQRGRRILYGAHVQIRHSTLAQECDGVPILIQTVKVLGHA